jgi:hypothetical protein
VRAVLGAAGLFMIEGGVLTDLAGVGLLVGAVLLQRVVGRAPAAAE